MEAQACYSLGNTYTLLQQYERAIDYHLKHLYIAQELTDRYCLKTIERKPNKWPQEQVFFNVVRSLFHRVGEGRACWSLGNAYVSLGNHKQALYYARKHLEISKEVRKLYKRNNIKRPLAFYVIFFLSLCPWFHPQIGDRNGELTARMNVDQLMEALGVTESDLSPSSSEFEMQGSTEIIIFLAFFTWKVMWSCWTLCLGYTLLMSKVGKLSSQ